MDAKTWNSEHTERGEGGGCGEAYGAAGGIRTIGGCVEMRPSVPVLASEFSLDHPQSIGRKPGK